VSVATDPSASAQVELAEFVAQFYDDPLGFVLACYPWGEPGILERHDGPDQWQQEHLTQIGRDVAERKFDGMDAVAPIRHAISSGHGIGKSVEVAWIVNWLMSTRPHCQGTVTANTFTQLTTKTWASVRRWTALCLTHEWFVVNTDRMYHADHPASWFTALQSSKEENSEAFAGQHAHDSTSFYIFDEASAIPEKIFEVAEGGLTDGEPMIFLFGNPTRSNGKFHRVCFGSEKARWTSTIVDSRTSRFTNKALLEEWVTDYGEDSDFVRVRVRGLPPRASDAQYIASDLVYAAQKRPLMVLPDDPLVCGLDIARGGDDKCVFRFRRGNDARSIAPLVIPGEQARDSMRLVTVADDILSRHPITMLFIDGTGIGGPICDRLRQMGHRNIMEVQFGGESPDPKMANMRAFMWSRLREWLRIGAIDAMADLETDLTAPGYHHDKKDRVVLESKESMKARELASPDHGDALALTFAGTPRKKVVSSGRLPTVGGSAGWMA